MGLGLPHVWALQLAAERPFPVSILLRIEVDAVGDSNEHKTVGNAIVLGHAHPDAVAGRGTEVINLSNGRSASESQGI